MMPLCKFVDLMSVCFLRALSGVDLVSVALDINQATI